MFWQKHGNSNLSPVPVVYGLLLFRQETNRLWYMVFSFRIHLSVFLG